MTEQATIHQLIGDVAAVKADVTNLSRQQSKQWEKLERSMEQIGECNRKLDKLVGQEDRLQAVETSADDYRRTKNRAVAFVSGLGIALGGIGGAVSSWVSRWLS